MDLKQIKEHWEKVGKEFQLKQSISPTSRDPYLAELEQKNILSYLKPEMNVLEIGCGDASHTIEYTKVANKTTAIELSNNLLVLAKQNIRKNNMQNITLKQVSVLEILKQFKNVKFDAIISQRCLINLPTWSYQREALNQLDLLLNTNGLLLLSEEFDNELRNLNNVRLTNSLTEIKVAKYNKNFANEEFESFITKNFEIEAIKDYGFYLYMSRIFHPLAVLPKNPQHHSPLNEVALVLASQSNFPDFKRFSYNLFYI